MKTLEKQKAIELRRQGYSINDIRRKLNVAKSSISIWVRDVKLNQKQKQYLAIKGFKSDIVEKRRNTRLVKENTKRQLIIDKAKQDIKNLSEKDLFLIGIIFYWAEGSKTRRGVVEFSNGDPNAIKVMMKFFRNICRVPKKKFRGHIHIHENLDIKKAENYWSVVSEIPLSQFFKTYNKPNKSSKGKKNSLPFGTFSIYVCDTELFLKIKGWIEGVVQQAC